LTDSHRLIRYVSPSVERVLGYRPNDVIGMDAFALVHPDDLAATEEAFQRALQNPWLSHRIEHRLRHQDGTWRSAETIAQAHQREFGMDVAISTRDITERQRAAEMLTTERNFLQTIINAIPDVIFVKDTEGRFLINNAYHLRTLGATTQAETFGKTVFDFHPPDLAERYLADDQRILETEQPLIEKEQPYLNCISGERRWHLMTKVPLRDASGKMIGIVGTGRDITERKRTEQAMIESEKRFRTLIESAPVAISLGRDGRLIYANPAYVQMYGFASADELIGSTVSDRVAPQSRDESFERSRLRAQGMPVEPEYDLVGLRRDGTEFPMIATVTRVNLADGPANIGFFQDITERKRAEAQLKKYSEQLEQMVEARTRELRDAQEQLVRQERLATLGQLAGSIAHELRSPLGAIKNAAYYFKMCVENPSADAREMMQILDEQVDISARVIGSLLDFARPKAPTLQRAHLPHVIDAAARQCDLPNNIALRWQVAENLPAVMVDAGQMQLVFRNLIANALQAMPEGGELVIAVNATAETICASFSDTGRGIPPEAVDKIFQPLYTTKAKGIGLGLAMCKMLVEAHNGKIQVTSQVG
ncbi:MAG: PAS domain S-box protein, partial [Anaerolineales bacterium]|nr:PAS domain S-box protein [Anaerolineales bacterium]